MKKLIFVALVICLAMPGFAQKSAIRVEVTGKGSPVVFLPGFGCSGHVWDNMVEVLKKNHECHIVSYAGFDGVPAINTLWMATVEKSLQQYLTDEKLDRITIVGHSIGGTFGLMLSNVPQSKVARLVVVDMLPCIGMVMIPNYKPEYITFDNPYNKKLLDMNNADFKAMQKQMTSGMCADTTQQKQIVEWMMMADRKTYVYGYTELMQIDLRQALKTIEQPVLVLAAGKYPTKEQILKIYDEQYLNLKNKTIRFVDNSAHFVMYDQPLKLSEEITNFITVK